MGIVREHNPGAWGWAGLWAFVAGYDIWAIRNDKPTLSETFGVALKHPIKRWPVMLAWGGLTLHLFAELLPEEVRKRLAPVDPLGQLARLIEPKE